MGKGLIAGMLAGFGEALEKTSAQNLHEMALAARAERMAEIQRERDENLSGLAEGRDIRGEQRKRDQAVAVGTEAEKARTGMVDDPSGAFRARTTLEGSEAEAGVYRKHGLIEAAQRTQENERGRQERAESRLDARTDRNADNERADKQLTATIEHQKRQDTIAMQNAVRLKNLTDAQIEQIKGGKVPLPKLKVETIDVEGVKTIVNVDENSGAIGVVQPGESATPGETYWFAPNKPGKPASQTTVTWSLNGRVLPGGLSDLYPAMKARIGDQGGTGGIVDPFGTSAAKGAKWNDVTGDVLYDGKKIGTAKSEAEARTVIASVPGREPPQAAIDALRKDPKLAGQFEEHYKLPKGGAAKYLPAQAEQSFGPAVGTVSKGYRFSGGDPNARSNWEPATGPGAALDMARAEKAAALARLQGYGLRQQKHDAEGFTAAQSALRQAEAALAEAEQAWQRSVGGDMGAARFVTQP